MVNVKNSALKIVFGNVGKISFYIPIYDNTQFILQSPMPCTEAYKEHIMYMFNRAKFFYGFPSTFFHTTSLRLFSKVYTYLFYLKRYFIIADFLCHHHSLYPDQRVILL